MFPRILFVLAATAHALALTCQTGPGSPLAADAVTMANQMAQNSGVACQSSNTGCTQQWQFGTAAVDLCGPLGTCVPFTQLASGVQALVNNCQANGQAGGINQLNADGSLHSDLYHT
ncbi:hypothetical protein DFH08DRAFT_955512 [Mycena albidolilacea]|uniref:Uncharacterized protein n=1 Tax=Mycena albidolilacea TaxID=1033008 RepID=A0AAD7ABX4_9AGAR|nr:hypothetical protein DFH08DRAFT_955512 [Mycena albidolilacea]